MPSKLDPQPCGIKVGLILTLLNGTIRENGNWRDGMAQDYGTGSITLTSIVTDGVVRGSNFSQEIVITKLYWRGTFAELVDLQRALAHQLSFAWSKDILLINGVLRGFSHPVSPLPVQRPCPERSVRQPLQFIGEARMEATNVELWENKEELGYGKRGLTKAWWRRSGGTGRPRTQRQRVELYHQASKLLDGQLPKRWVAFDLDGMVWSEPTTYIQPRTRMAPEQGAHLLPTICPRGRT